jgi:hypothetical protein
LVFIYYFTPVVMLDSYLLYFVGDEEMQLGDLQ